jgi:RNA polymerase sigma factor (sigma-70 family)
MSSFSPPQEVQAEFDSWDQYLREISTDPLLDHEEERRLTREIRQGDTLALERLVRANLRLVAAVAKRYENQGVSLADLITEGNAALVRAAQRFDETQGGKFTSYAVWWIRQAILHALSRHSHELSSGAPGKSKGPNAHGAEARRELEEALFRRVEDSVRASLRRMTPSELMRAVEASTPAATVAQIISASPDVGLSDETSWTRALARGAARKQELIQRAGGMLSSSQVAELLGITVSAVNQRKNRHRSILAVPLSGGEWGFPARQFVDGGIRAGVTEVVRAAGKMNPWVLLSILLDDANGAGGPTLLDRLDDESVRADVLNRVDTYGEHVAA